MKKAPASEPSSSVCTFKTAGVWVCSVQLWMKVDDFQVMCVQRRIAIAKVVDSVPVVLGRTPYQQVDL